MYTLTEKQLDKIYTHIEEAVFAMAEPGNMKVNQKYDIIDNFFAEIMQKCEVEQVS